MGYIPPPPPPTSGLVSWSCPNKEPGLLKRILLQLIGRGIPLAYVKAKCEACDGVGRIIPDYNPLKPRLCAICKGKGVIRETPPPRS